ncbi:MAG: hypothetical protein RIS54_1246 [Verrucomicrobiota bacterium]|jgi:hypothetical protein
MQSADTIQRLRFFAYIGVVIISLPGLRAKLLDPEAGLPPA